jgi:TRAP-type uncharacterized transport system substrate-binding protein
VRRRAFAIGLVAGALALPAVAAAQNVTIGTNPPGSVFYAVGSGLAKVVAEGGGPVKLAVQPYSGSSTFLPLLNTGEMEFGVVNAVDMALAYREPDFKVGGRNPFAKVTATRATEGSTVAP